VYATIELGLNRRLRQQCPCVDSPVAMRDERNNKDRLRRERWQMRINTMKQRTQRPTMVGKYALLHMITLFALIIFFLWILYGSFKR
jgi:hypothetical protein